VSTATIRSGPPPGTVSRQVPYPPGGPSRLAGVNENPAPPGGPGPGAAVPDRVAVLVDHRHAPGRLRVGRGGVDQVPRQPGVDRAVPGQLAGPVGQPGGGAERHGQGDPPGEPAPGTAGRTRARRLLRPAAGPVAAGAVAGVLPGCAGGAMKREAVIRPRPRCSIAGECGIAGEWRGYAVPAVVR